MHCPLHFSLSALWLLSSLESIESWGTPSVGSRLLPLSISPLKRLPAATAASRLVQEQHPCFQEQLRRRAGRHVHGTSTSLSMYNLPPPKNEGGLGEIASTVLGVVLVVAFFVSPLGGFVLGLMNSFLLLLILLPFLGTAAFNIWQYFNTISAPCPNCGAEARVLKRQDNSEDVPSICISCGSILQANYDNTGIDNITGKNSVDGLSSPFGGSSIFDIFTGGSTIIEEEIITTTTTSRNPFPGGSSKTTPKGSETIIDVESEEEKPFQ